MASKRCWKIGENWDPCRRPHAAALRSDQEAVLTAISWSRVLNRWWSQSWTHRWIKFSSRSYWCWYDLCMWWRKSDWILVKYCHRKQPTILYNFQRLLLLVLLVHHLVSSIIQMVPFVNILSRRNLLNGSLSIHKWSPMLLKSICGLELVIQWLNFMNAQQCLWW